MKDLILPRTSSEYTLNNLRSTVNVSAHDSFTGTVVNDASQTVLVDNMLVTFLGCDQFVKLPSQCTQCAREMWHSRDISLSCNQCAPHLLSHSVLTADTGFRVIHNTHPCRCRDPCNGFSRTILSSTCSS